MDPSPENHQISSPEAKIKEHLKKRAIATKIKEQTPASFKNLHGLAPSPRTIDPRIIEGRPELPENFNNPYARETALNERANCLVGDHPLKLPDTLYLEELAQNSTPAQPRGFEPAQSHAREPAAVSRPLEPRAKAFEPPASINIDSLYAKESVVNSRPLEPRVRVFEPSGQNNFSTSYARQSEAYLGVESGIFPSTKGPSDLLESFSHDTYSIESAFNQIPIEPTVFNPQTASHIGAWAPDLVDRHPRKRKDSLNSFYGAIHTGTFQTMDKRHPSSFQQLEKVSSVFARVSKIY